jgi:hypothetical protein
MRADPRYPFEDADSFLTHYLRLAKNNQDPPNVGRVIAWRCDNPTLQT